MDHSDKATRTGKCPICRDPTEQRYRPFCSRRCADVDLSRWLSGVYAIPSRYADDDEDGDAARAASLHRSPASDDRE